MTNLKDRTLEKILEVVKPLFLGKKELIDFYSKKGDFKKAAKTAERALRKMENSHNCGFDEEVGMLRLAIKNYVKAGDFENAFNMKSYRDNDPECIRIVEKSMDDYIKAGNSENILKVAREVDHEDSTYGKLYLRKASEYFEKAGDFENAAKTAEGLDFEKATELYIEAISKCGANRAYEDKDKLEKSFKIVKDSKDINKVIASWIKKGYDNEVSAYIADKAGITNQLIQWMNGHSYDSCAHSINDFALKSKTVDKEILKELLQKNLEERSFDDVAKFSEKIGIDKVIKNYEKAGEFDSAIYVAEANGMKEKANELYKLAIENYEKNNDFIRASYFSRKAGDLENAAKFSEKANKIDPKLKAIINHNGDEKYIVVKNNKDNTTYLVSSAKKDHSGILNEFEKEIEGDLRVMGGGILSINKENKYISTYGRSGDYGKPDKKLVEEILMHNYPEYNVDVKVTNYVKQ